MSNLNYKLPLTTNEMSNLNYKLPLTTTHLYITRYFYPAPTTIIYKPQKKIAYKIHCLCTKTDKSL
jgi:hypothetical protein